MYQTIKVFISLLQQLHSVKLAIDHQVAQVVEVTFRLADVVILVKESQLLKVSYLLKDMKDLPNMLIKLVTV